METFRPSRHISSCTDLWAPTVHARAACAALLVKTKDDAFRVRSTQRRIITDPSTSDVPARGGNLLAVCLYTAPAIHSKANSLAGLYGALLRLFHPDCSGIIRACGAIRPLCYRARGHVGQGTTALDSTTEGAHSGSSPLN